MNFGTEAKTKAWKDIWESGQGIGAIHEITGAAAFVDKLHQEYLAARGRLNLI
jgi:nitronate monooxygenase